MKNSKSGGLYKNLKMSIRTANILVLVTAFIFVLCLAFAVNHNGFTVTFNTNGGSQIESCKVMYGEKIRVTDPTKDDYVFTGWYVDKDCSNRWDSDCDTASESMTLYAGWTEKDK